MSRELKKLKLELNIKLQPLEDSISKLNLTVQSLRDFDEMSLFIQTLQATSYNEEYTVQIVCYTILYTLDYT